MPRWSSKAPRSATEWGIRGGLALGVAVLGYISVTHTLAYTVRANATEHAHALAPGDGRITSLVAQRLAGVAASPGDRSRSDALARLALQQDPTAVVAVTTLGLNAQLKGNTAQARRLFAYAERLSRRELQTQLWAIEDGVGRSDIPAILYNYDIALRTSRNASEVLFPILASALGDPEIRGALVKTMIGRPLWGPSFINFASANASSEAATSLFRSLSRAGVPITDEPRARVVTSMIKQGHVNEAWAYYVTFRQGANRQSSRDPRFMANIASPTPFDWVPANDDGITTSIQRNGTLGVFDFAAPSSVGGALLRQVQVLPPGKYALVGHSMALDQEPNVRPYWSLTCADGRELGRFELPNSTQGNGQFRGLFSVPSNCAVQTLMLVARPVDSVNGLTGQIDHVMIAPIR